MTKSAKQDTEKAPAKRAEMESAATQGDTGTEPGAEAETDGAAAAASGSAVEDGAQPELDDVKRKFREALDRKRQLHTEGQGKGGRDAGKVSGAHGPAASRRNFRRKSG